MFVTCEVFDKCENPEPLVIKSHPVYKGRVSVEVGDIRFDSIDGNELIMAIQNCMNS